MGYKINKEVVETVKKYSKKYPDMATEEIGKLVGISQSSVSSILRGGYDSLLLIADKPKESAEAKEEKRSVKSQIPYEEYRRLVSCDIAMKEIMSCARKTLSDDEELFIDYRLLSNIIKRYLPDEYQQRVNEVYNED